MIKFTATLSRYIAHKYLVNTLYLLAILLGMIFIFDMIELLRRAGRNDIPFMTVLQMGMLKLPEVGQRLVPFAILFSAMFTFWQLSKRYELVVMRAAGFSVWQFLAPVVGVAVFVGIFQVMLINPLGAIMLGKFKAWENVNLKHYSSQIAFFEEGLWLRQDIGNNGDYAVLNASGIRQKEWTLEDVMLLKFDADDNFIQRMDAQQARLEPGQWVLEDITVHTADQPKAGKMAVEKLPTSLTIQEIEDSFASIDTMSFWSLPLYIQTLEATGFDATHLRVYYQNLWAQPLFFAAMVLLAATVSLRPPRQRGTFVLIALGVFIGLVVFFMSNFLQALGTSHQIPVTLAAWSPGVVCLLLGLSVIMTLEDG